MSSTATAAEQVSKCGICGWTLEGETREDKEKGTVHFGCYVWLNDRRREQEQQAGAAKAVQA